jgi:hypothetical protein
MTSGLIGTGGELLGLVIIGPHVTDMAEGEEWWSADTGRAPR